MPVRPVRNILILRKEADRRPQRKLCRPRRQTAVCLTSAFSFYRSDILGLCCLPPRLLLCQHRPHCPGGKAVQVSEMADDLRLAVDPAQETFPVLRQFQICRRE